MAAAVDVNAVRDVGIGPRAPLLLPAFASLFFGVSAGLVLLGWHAPAARLAALHGPLMASGFFGTVISLERAVALGRPWAYAAPLASGLGALAALFALPEVIAPALSVAGSAVLLTASMLLYRRQRQLFMLTIALGSACWTGGNLLWLGGLPISVVVPWWIAFLVLTIAGERLELSRLLPASPVAKKVFAGLLVMLLAGVGASVFAPAVGTGVLGFALASLALWLWRQDIARRTVKNRGLTRFIAVCLLSGYLWLAAGGVLMLVGGLGTGGMMYDAALHALLLGFVFSMVFGHAPIIIPAVMRVSVPYHPYFYGALVLLHGSLLARFAGDIASMPGWRAWGGAFNALALLAFVIGTIAAVIRGSRAAGARH